MNGKRTSHECKHRARLRRTSQREVTVCGGARCPNMQRRHAWTMKSPNILHGLSSDCPQGHGRIHDVGVDVVSTTWWMNRFIYTFLTHVSALRKSIFFFFRLFVATLCASLKMVSEIKYMGTTPSLRTIAKLMPLSHRLDWLRNLHNYTFFHPLIWPD